MDNAGGYSFYTGALRGTGHSTTRKISCRRCIKCFHGHWSTTTIREVIVIWRLATTQDRHHIERCGLAKTPRSQHWRLDAPIAKHQKSDGDCETSLCSVASFGIQCLVYYPHLLPKWSNSRQHLQSEFPAWSRSSNTKVYQEYKYSPSNCGRSILRNLCSRGRDVWCFGTQCSFAKLSRATVPKPEWSKGRFVVGSRTTYKQDDNVAMVVSNLTSRCQNVSIRPIWTLACFTISRSIVAIMCLRKGRHQIMASFALSSYGKDPPEQIWQHYVLFLSTRTIKCYRSPQQQDCPTLCLSPRSLGTLPEWLSGQVHWKQAITTKPLSTTSDLSEQWNGLHYRLYPRNQDFVWNLCWYLPSKLMSSVKVACTTSKMVERIMWGNGAARDMSVTN